MSAIKTLSSSAVAAIASVAGASSQCERATLAALPVLRAEFAGVSRDIVRDTIVVNFAAAVGITLNVAKSGRITFPASADSAKRACNRFIERVMGVETDKVKPEQEVPAHIMALAKKLADACNEYNDSRKIATTAVARAFAK
jgi:hypothetical protein